MSRGVRVAKWNITGARDASFNGRISMIREEMSALCADQAIPTQLTRISDT